MSCPSPSHSAQRLPATLFRGISLHYSLSVVNVELLRIPIESFALHSSSKFCVLRYLKANVISWRSLYVSRIDRCLLCTYVHYPSMGLRVLQNSYVDFMDEQDEVKGVRIWR